MKNRYYIYASAGVAVIFILQILYIGSLYTNYTLSEQQHIEDCIYEAIDLEFFYREVNDRTPDSEVQYKFKAPIQFSELSKQEQDSLVKIHPDLGKSQQGQQEWHDVQQLIDRGVIRSSVDIITQAQQDALRLKENHINLSRLDSIFDNHLNRNYENRFDLLDENDHVVSSEGDLTKYNYTTKKIAIGLEEKRFLIASVDIKFSNFIKVSIFTLILSFVIVLFSLLLLIYFVTVLRRKDRMLQRCEINLSGIIHDLKSPLIGVSAMLNLYHMLEQDQSRKEILRCNKHSVNLLCSQVERLSVVAKNRIEISKELTSAEVLIERAQTIIEGLKIRYNDKKATVNITQEVSDQLNIDVICFDSIITNLVENALKYSHAEVDINIDLCRRKDQLYITVDDSGIGINSREAKLIFNYLYRGPDHSIKGSGVGLAYIHAVARAHGGNAKLLSSEVGKGSKFGVVLDIK
ncbi:MAG: HAMP domain-containing sensor histidine kinase [Rikenellaceae bacterium]